MDENVNESEDDDYATEARLLRKLKRGEITEEEFETATGERDLDIEIEAAEKERAEKKQSNNNGNSKKRKTNSRHYKQGSNKRLRKI